MTNQVNHTDRGLIALARWEKRMRVTVRHLLTDQVIAEHQRDPRGDHSDTLKRVLNFFRRSSKLTPHAVICTLQYRQWRIVRLTGIRGQAPVMEDERTFTSEAAAVHAVFLKRVDEVMHD